MSSVVTCDAAVEQGAGLAAEDQVLHGPRAGAPAQPVADELRHARLADARLPHQRQGVLDDVVGHRHFAHQLLQFEDLLAAQHRRDLLSLSAPVVRRAISNSSLKLGYFTNTLNMKRSCCASGSG